MSHQHRLLGAGGVSLALLLTASNAHAIAALSFTNTPDADDAFLAWAADNNFVESFVAEGRYGDNGGRAEWEIDLYPGGQSADNPLEFTWPNGVALDFSLAYDGTSVLASFQVSGTEDTLSLVGLPGQPLNTLAFRKQSPSDGSTDIIIDTLEIDGVTQSNPSFLGTSQTEYIVIPGVGEFNDGFLLEGTVTFTFNDPDNAEGSRQAFQIKVGNSTAPPVPEPSAYAAILGVVALAGVALRRRLRRKSRV
ncbi:MAG: choice-of-anchor W domain-containing protein [Opitutales bacterium]